MSERPLEAREVAEISEAPEGDVFPDGDGSRDVAPLRAEKVSGELRLDVPFDLVEAIALRAAELLAEREAIAEPMPFFTVDEAAGYLRCKPKRLYDLCSQRRIPFVKDGSRTLLRRTDLDAYLEASR